MVLISIHPFAVRKIFLLAVALLGLSSAFCFADPVFMARQYAPSQPQVRSGCSAKTPLANAGGSPLGGRSFETLFDWAGDTDSIASLRLWDKVNPEMPSGILGKAVALPGVSVCWRSNMDSHFALAALEARQASERHNTAD
jgi:hypothetical protein